jgi:hypothetical protein
VTHLPSDRILPASARLALPSRALLRRPRRMGRRAALLGGLGLVAFAVGAIAGGRGDDPRAAIARKFARAWERSDYAAMHALLSAPARKRATVRRRSPNARVRTVTGRRYTPSRPLTGFGTPVRTPRTVAVAAAAS